MSEAQISIITANPEQLDPVAVDQLQRTANLEGIERVVGLPDLHAGRGIAVGAAFWSPDKLFPHLVGGDIGCGMALLETDMRVHKFKLDRADRALHGLDAPWDGDQHEALASAGLPDDLANGSLGTIGGGNHFAEFQRIEAVVDRHRFDALGFSDDRIWLMVHSGSRGLGQAVLDKWIGHGADQGIDAATDAGALYRIDHDQAMRWAVLNREVIGHRFCEKLSLDAARRLDICHNSVTPHQGGWLHRKGAAPADRGLVVIPGSRGDLSYLVEPNQAFADASLHSLAHGAGRKWSRSDAHARLSRCFKVSELERTALGGRVICEDRRLIFEEAPEAYKDIHNVIRDLADAGLVYVVATLRPLLSYKTRRT